MCNLTPVKSSNVAAIGYEAETATIVVEYRDGKVYRFPDQTPEAWAALQAAESKGRAVAALGRGDWSGMTMRSKPEVITGLQVLTEDASACCRSRWEAALDRGKLAKVEVWSCPKCGCEYRPTMAADIRVWHYAGAGAVLFKAR